MLVNGYRRTNVELAGKVKLLLVLTDYLSKWIEAKAFEKINAKKLKSSYGKILYVGMAYDMRL